MQIYQIELDAVGLNCPLAVLKVRKQLKEMDSVKFENHYH